MRRLGRPIGKVVRRLLDLRSPSVFAFQSDAYLLHNQRRLEHLASLGLAIQGRSVLEVGAGIGDHTRFFLDRDCRVVTSDARPQNVRVLRARFPDLRVVQLDLDDPPQEFEETFDLVYCYGLLYHLQHPSGAIAFMSRCCLSMLLLETCVSYGDEDAQRPVLENLANPTQSLSGWGCRPTRRWVYNRLREHFAHAYLPLTQPDHGEFPLDWTVPPTDQRLTRSVFIASRQPITNDLLVEDLPRVQRRLP